MHRTFPVWIAVMLMMAGVLLGVVESPIIIGAVIAAGLVAASRDLLRSYQAMS